MKKLILLFTVLFSVVISSTAVTITPGEKVEWPEEVKVKFAAEQAALPASSTSNKITPHLEKDLTKDAPYDIKYDLEYLAVVSDSDGNTVVETQYSTCPAPLVEPSDNLVIIQILALGSFLLLVGIVATCFPNSRYIIVASAERFYLKKHIGKGLYEIQPEDKQGLATFDQAMEVLKERLDKEDKEAQLVEEVEEEVMFRSNDLKRKK